MSVFEFNETYKPFKYPWAVEMAALHEKVHWTEEEAEVGRDVEVWKSNLTDAERNIITHILRLFTQSDVAVGRSYIDNLLPVIGNNELRCLLLSFAAREGIHQRAYALVNDTLNLPEENWSIFLQYKEMKDKWEQMNWRYANDSVQGIALNIAKQIFTEGVSLFAAFIMLLQFRLSGKMMGMGEIVKWSIRDESMHVDGLTRIFKEICREFPEIVDDDFKKIIYECAREVVTLEEAYIDAAFQHGNLEHLSKEETKQYVQFITDRRLGGLGLKSNYGVDNPCPWVEEIVYGRGSGNFFEVKITDYSNAGLTGEWAEAYDTTF